MTPLQRVLQAANGKESGLLAAESALAAVVAPVVRL